MLQRTQPKYNYTMSKRMQRVHSLHQDMELY